MGIDTTASRTPLLEDADQNIGNSATVRPQAGTAGTIIPQSLQNRIINLSNGGSARGQTTSVVVTARRILPGTADNPSPTGGLPGPLTGIVEFGNGGRSTRAEFDVPIGPFTGSFGGASPALEPQDGGVILTVPTGVLRVFVRYDNLLIAPVLATVPPVSLAQLFSVTFLGPGGPFNGEPPEPVLVQSMAAYFSRPAAKVYKTLYLYVSLPSPPAPPAPLNLTPAMGFCLPAFAKTVKILRKPLTSALDVQLYNNIRSLDEVTIAAGVTSPTFDVIGHETIITIGSHTPADTVTFLAMVCEIGI
jgi:hypothetical protein